MRRIRPAERTKKPWHHCAGVKDDRVSIDICIRSMILGWIGGAIGGGGGEEVDQGEEVREHVLKLPRRRVVLLTHGVGYAYLWRTL